MLMYSQQNACFKHSNFFTVNDADPVHDKSMPDTLSTRIEGGTRVRSSRAAGRNAPPRNTTTSFLTATTLIYAIGAGITAAAGTRLALQLILVKGFKLFSFRLQDH